jgi:sorbitol-specific phosphotransferase system component IIC
MKKGEEKLKKDRKEGWMRIPVGIISGVIIYIWAYLICLFFVINIIYKIITGKRIKSLSDMSEVWNTQNYHFMRYMTFCTNEKPFPFEELKKDINKVEN